MRSLLPAKYHYYIYIFSLILLVAGLPLSKFLMSLSQIILFCNWLLSGDLKAKFISFFNNKAALVLCSLLILHLFGLLYTSDFHYALNDIRIKIPLLLLPIVLSTSPPLEKKTFNFILQLFTASVIIGTIASTLVLTGIIHKEIIDIRSISLFISHIRFALLICIAIFCCIYFMKKTSSVSYKIAYGITAAWLVSFLIIMESITGIAALLTAGFVLLVYQIFSLNNKRIKYISILFICCFIAAAGYWAAKNVTGRIKTDTVDFSKLEAFTTNGNSYQHFKLSQEYTENGHFIWIYYCEKELLEEWPKRSKLDYNGLDLKGNTLRFTLLRYLASKDLRKDADGLKQLSDDEIRAIERGAANVNYRNISSIGGRLHEIIWELKMYELTGDANGHSLTQRFEYWKAARGVISEHPLFGVGTGDVQKAFDEQYIKTKSSLQPNLRFHSHNQYLTITAAFGIIGLIWFLITLFYPMIKLNKMDDFLYITFFIIAAVSFFTEDTLETQAGVTFFAFFNSFFLFVNPAKKLRR